MSGREQGGYDQVVFGESEGGFIKNVDRGVEVGGPGFRFDSDEWTHCRCRRLEQNTDTKSNTKDV